MKAQLSPLFTWRSAIAESELPSTARLVACMISLHMSERGDSCFPSFERLAAECGVHRSTVIRSIKELEEAGFLIVHRAENPGRGKAYTNRYESALPKRVAEKHSLPERVAEDAKKGSGVLPESVIESVILSEGRSQTPPRIDAKAKNEKTNGNGAGEVQALVGYFVDVSRRQGVEPTGRIKGHLATQLQRLLKEGKDPRALRPVVGVLAEEGKPPGHIDYVLVDYERTRKGGSR